MTLIESTLETLKKVQALTERADALAQTLNLVDSPIPQAIELGAVINELACLLLVDRAANSPTFVAQF
jgi:hypothetical protein